MILLEMTLWQLDRSTQNNFGDGREFRSNVIEVNDIRFNKIVEGNKTMLEVSTKTRGSTGNRYDTIIRFTHPVFSETETESTISLETSGGTLYVDKSSINKSDVQVTCDCLDFYWRFATWNKQHKSLLGNPPPPYIKTTDRPPVNPRQRPGVCKHLYKLVNQLRAIGLM